MARIARHLVSLRSRLADERGTTLIELLTVMIILGIVLAPIATSFASASRAQVTITRREEAFGQARTALERMRLDIHCAHATSLPVQENDYGGFTLTLPQTPGQCPGVVPATSGSAGVEWCTIPYAAGDTTRYRLYRYNATSLGDCNGGAGSTFTADYITQPAAGWPTNAATQPAPEAWAGNIWPTADTCTSGYLPTIAVDLVVGVDPVKHPNERYELQDRIAALNSDPC